MCIRDSDEMVGYHRRNHHIGEREIEGREQVGIKALCTNHFSEYTIKENEGIEGAEHQDSSHDKLNAVDACLLYTSRCV